MANPSEVAICNSALLAIGEDTITSVQFDASASVAARVCNQFYRETRDAMLRAYPWNFANEKAALARLADTPVFAYRYAFQLPADPAYCLRVLRPEHKDTEYIIKGRVLETDDSAINIEYTKRVTDPNQFDALFYEAFTLRLAMKIAAPITRKQTMVQLMASIYQVAIDDAYAADAFETVIDSNVEMTETERLADVRY